MNQPTITKVAARREQVKYFLLSKRKRKARDAKSEPNKRQAGKWAVGCVKHGKKDHTSPMFGQVVVGIPKNKRIRRSGCPICRKEAVNGR